MNHPPPSTRAWAASLARSRADLPVAARLRLPDTRPPRLPVREIRPLVLELAECAAVVAHSVARRQVPPGGLGEPALGGRCLAFYPGQTLSDGAAEAESGGFFDVHNQPPWDSWDRVEAGATAWEYRLVCWIPESLVSLVNEGVYVNPEGCIIWLDDLPAQVGKESGLR